MEKFCPTCEDYVEIKSGKSEQAFKVKDVEIRIPVGSEFCAVCGEKLGSDEQDQQILDTVNAEYRKKTDLLTSERIKQIRHRYRLSQKCFALLLGMSEATINRYESGALQEQSHDNAMRACESPEFMRDLLQRRGHLLTDLQRERVLKALSGQEVVDGFIEFPCVGMLNEISNRTGFRRFDYERFAYVVIQLCSDLGEVCTTTINKLLFYADFLNFKTATVSLTGTAYRRLPYGPVPTDYDGLLSKMEYEGLVTREEIAFPSGYTGYYYKPGQNSGSIHVRLNKHESNVLAYIVQEFRSVSAKEISERSHQEAAWIDTPDKDLISYEKAQFLTLNLPE